MWEDKILPQYIGEDKETQTNFIKTLKHSQCVIRLIHNLGNNTLKVKWHQIKLMHVKMWPVNIYKVPRSKKLNSLIISYGLPETKDIIDQSPCLQLWWIQNPLIATLHFLFKNNKIEQIISNTNNERSETKHKQTTYEQHPMRSHETWELNGYV